MSQPPSNSGHQPESPQPRVDQHSNGNSLGGQQAAIGNNNNQFQDNSTNYKYHYSYNYYDELQNKDLEPLNFKGKILSCFGVFIALILTLIFWFFFGLFISFPFPFRQALELIGSCFRGKLGAKVNNLQKQLQLKDFDSLSIDKLNEIDFQARLYLDVLKCIGTNKVGNHERLAKTIEALKQKRVILQYQIKPRQPKKYQTVSKAQNFFESFILRQTEGDWAQIEAILVEVNSYIRSSYPSEKIVQDALDKLSREASRKAVKISPNRLGFIYRIETLLHEVSVKEISSLEESELQNFNRKFIGELKEERDLLTRKLNGILGEEKAAQQILEGYVGEISRLNGLLEERETDLLNLRESINRYAETDRNQRDTINTLSSDLAKAREDLKDLQEQKTKFNAEVTRLKQTLQQKQNNVDQIKNQIKEISRLNGLLEEHETDLLNLRKSISRYAETDRSQRDTINTLSSDLAKTREVLRVLQGQKTKFNEEVTQLKQTLQRKQVDIDQLINQVNQYSGIRILKGEYIGNLSDPTAKYHFDRRCNHWKMLVGEYVLGLDRSREIVSSSDPTFFFGKLEECEGCARRRNSY